jgi:hypothetical protein
MEVEGPNGGWSAAPTETGTLSDEEKVHKLQPAAAIEHSEGDSYSYPKKNPNVKSRFDAAESGTLLPAPQAERIDKRDT